MKQQSIFLSSKVCVNELGSIYDCPKINSTSDCLVLINETKFEGKNIGMTETQMKN